MRKKAKVKAAALIIITLAVMAALAAGSFTLQQRQDGAGQGGFSETQKEELCRSLRDTAWVWEQGEFKEVYLFCMVSDCWHGEMYDGKMRGCWGTYEITGEKTFLAAPYPENYCDFAGTHAFSLAEDKKSIVIDGTVYQKTEIGRWLGPAYASDLVPEDAITEGEDD